MKNKEPHLKVGINILFIALIIFSFSCQTYQSGKLKNDIVPNSDYDARKIKIISILEELSDIKYSNDSQMEENRQKIIKIIDKLENPRDLMTLALMSKNLSGNCHDIECYKASNLRPTYENTYWAVVKKLTVNKEENKKILDELKIRSQLTGTDIGDWERVVDKKEFP